MNNKIHKVDSSVSPAPLRASYGPATAGMEWDSSATVQALTIVPDSGTRRTFNPVFTNAGAPTNGTSGTFATYAPKGSFLFDTTNSVLYVNKNTIASPTWTQVAVSGVLSPELSVTGISAGATQTQAGATAMTGQINNVTTVATTGDGVRLPASAVGLVITVQNQGAQPMKVYGAGTDTINGMATATGVFQGVGATATFICSVVGNWIVAIEQLQGPQPVALTTNGAINPHAGQLYAITKAGVLADTLAAPTAGAPGTGDDGLLIQLTSSTAFAHTLTATGLLQTGSASVNVATFNAQAGASLLLMAYNAKWVVLAANGVSFS